MNMPLPTPTRSSHRPAKLLAWILVVSTVAALAGFAFLAVVLQQESVFAENGPMENLQAILLVLSCVHFCALAFHTHAGYRLAAAFLALLSYGFVLREVDVGKLAFPPLVQAIAAGTGKTLSLAAGLIAIMVIALIRRRQTLAGAKAIARSPTGKLLIAGGVFCLIGDAFEKSSLAYHVLFEEGFEIVGYALMLLSSLAWRIRPPSDEAAPLL